MEIQNVSDLLSNFGPVSPTTGAGFGTSARVVFVATSRDHMRDPEDDDDLRGDRKMYSKVSKVSK